MQEMLFDYQDIYYGTGDPLDQLVKHETFKSLRNSFIALQEDQQLILDEMILKEKSIVNTSILLNISEKETNHLLNSSLNSLYDNFITQYYHYDDIVNKYQRN